MTCIQAIIRIEKIYQRKLDLLWNKISNETNPHNQFKPHQVRSQHWYLAFTTLNIFRLSRTNQKSIQVEDFISVAALIEDWTAVNHPWALEIGSWSWVSDGNSTAPRGFLLRVRITPFLFLPAEATICVERVLDLWDCLRFFYRLHHDMQVCMCACAQIPVGQFKSMEIRFDLRVCSSKSILIWMQIWYY